MATRDERIQRQNLDDGGDTDTVYLKDGGRSGSGATTYHDDPDCPRLNQSGGVRETTRRDAHLQWKGPCGTCTIRGDDS